MNRIFQILAAALFIVTSPPPAAAGLAPGQQAGEAPDTILPTAPSRPAFGITGARESKYVSEGRNNLDDGGVYSLEGVAEWRELTAGAWFATGDSTSYEELNLFLNYGLELGPVYAFVGITRLEFLEDDASDNEISVGMEVGGSTYFTPALDYRYSTEADGGFMELSISSEIALLDGRLTLEPYIAEGFDFGYASQKHDGPNNFQAGVDFAYELADLFSIVGSVAHSRAHADVKNEGLGNVSWASIGVAAGF